MNEKSIIRPFTVGILPTLLRNCILALGIQPAINGFTQTSVAFLYALGGILLSHPFEVARVHIQTQKANNHFGETFKMMRGIYAIEGLGGLYRGAVPRAISILPLISSIGVYSAFSEL